MKNLHFLKIISKNKGLIKLNSFKFCTTTNELATLKNSIVKYDTKKLDRFQDYLIVSIRSFKTNPDSYYFNIFTSNLKYLKLKIFISSLLYFIPCFVIFYFLVKKLLKDLESRKLNNLLGHKLKISKMNFFFKTIGLVIISLIIRGILKFRTLNYWTYLKTIELSKDLKTLKFTTINNRQKIIPIEKTQNFDFIWMPQLFLDNKEIVGILINYKPYFLSLNSCNIPNKEIFSLCIKGYKLKTK